jgi:hypothetical protein
MPALYWRPLSITYHSNKFSCASCCTLVYIVLAAVLPYVVVFSLGGLWTKETPAREQPQVRSRYEVYVEAHATTPTSAIVPLLWSTSQPLNDAIGESLRPMQLRSWVEDDERDGQPDRLQYALTIPLDAASGERLHAVSVVLGIDMKFETEFSMRLNGSLHLQASSPLPGKSWVQSADLGLRSDEPMRALDLPARPPCAEPVWAFREPVKPDGTAASAASILAQYSACNDTATLVSQPPLWEPGVGDSFEALLTVNVPSVVTMRRPGLVETLKLAAVQYIAFFIPITFLLSCLHGALFRFGVVSSRVHHPVKQHQF